MITGAHGQLGRALQTVLAGKQLVALGHRDLDITQAERVVRAIEQHEPDLVINAAAFNDVDGAEDLRTEAFQLNAAGPRHLAIATQAHGITLVHVSTDYVFDGQARTPYHELALPRPISVYGASKLAGEAAVALHNPRHFVIRTAWLYHTEGQNFPKRMLALAARPTVNVVNDRFGSPTYAPHLAEAIAGLINSDHYGTYHLAGCGSASWFDLTELLFKQLGITTTVKPVSGASFKQRARRPDYSVLTTVREPKLLLPRWQDGIRQFAEEMWLKHEGQVPGMVGAALPGRSVLEVER
jgi:dTDP-4-dehydrorhamnose reductase